MSLLQPFIIQPMGLRPPPPHILILGNQDADKSALAHYLLQAYMPNYKTTLGFIYDPGHSPIYTDLSKTELCNYHSRSHTNQDAVDILHMLPHPSRSHSHASYSILDESFTLERANTPTLNLFFNSRHYRNMLIVTMSNIINTRHMQQWIMNADYIFIFNTYKTDANIVSIYTACVEGFMSFEEFTALLGALHTGEYIVINNTIHGANYTDFIFQFQFQCDYMRQRIVERATLLKPEIMEAYAKKTMHPSRLQGLLDNPELEVDDFMVAYINTL